jgi:uncharacterized protein (DUF1697 family)
MTVFIALLRAVNVGKRKVPSADLKEVCAEIGLRDPQTYVASGNLLFDANEDAAAVNERLERALASRFGFPVDVILRTGEQWPAYLADNPFPEASGARPNLVHLSLSKRPPKADAAAVLTARAAHGEKVALVRDGLWTDFMTGVADSKLTPASYEKAIGSPSTARNWRTVQKLAELVQGRH